MEIKTYTPEIVIKKAANIEQRLLNVDVDNNLVTETLRQKVTYVNGDEVTVRTLLADQDLTRTAIERSRPIYNDFYSIIGGLPDDLIQIKIDDNETNALAHTEIIQRARRGEYNGNSRRVCSFAEFYVGQYIGSTELMKPVIDRTKLKLSDN